VSLLLPSSTLLMLLRFLLLPLLLCQEPGTMHHCPAIRSRALALQTATAGTVINRGRNHGVAKKRRRQWRRLLARGQPTRPGDRA